VEAVAAQDGLDLRAGQALAANTFDAHRLALWAQQRGAGRALLERLFRAQFTDAADVADREVLVACARDAGLPEAEARTVLEGQEFADAVREDEAAAQRLGIGGVPFFVLDGRFGLSGAQPPEVFRRALALAASPPAADGGAGL
jgi:predicted DsbA family dithiol-disulfide isomerase